ncbi:hypothetical protein H0H81_006371 [Sphagnurus paluster]|uniref:Uncharacterized protein n=1 Tax=Sphagnurus paluster TaxID=117069 RepID=A0A9P7KIY1_9AGAR|nr:hypothetical protein H0H81_006371 [Sphagnurus paluster]
MPYLGRIRHLVIRDPRLIIPFLESPPHLMKFLHTLEIWDHGHEKNVWKVTSLGNAPNLRDIHLFGDPRPLLKSLIYFPLSQITNISLLYVPLRDYDILGILHLAPNLISGSFAIGNPNTVSILTEINDLIFPLIHNIHFLSLDHPQVETSLAGLQPDRLILSAVRNVSVRAWRWRPLLSPIILYSGALEKLDIQTASISVDDLRELLLGAPRLTFLSITRPRKPSVMLPIQIIDKIAEGALVPRLETLRCYIDSRHPAAPQMLSLHLDMLELRRLDTTKASHIANVTFCFLEDREWVQRFMLVGLLQRVKKMNQEGWKIEI